VTKITLYGTKTCPFCQKTRTFLKKNNLKFVDRYVEKDEKARGEMIKKSKQMNVPVIDIGGKILVGFDESKLKKSLNLED
jgi:glutaredoxin 3